MFSKSIDGYFVGPDLALENQLWLLGSTKQLKFGNNVTLSVPDQSAPVTISLPSTSSGSFIMSNSSLVQTISSPLTINSSGSSAINIGSGSYTGTLTLGNPAATVNILGVATIDGTSTSDAITIGSSGYTGAVNIGGSSISVTANSTGSVSIGNGLNSIYIGSQGTANSVVNIQPGTGSNSTNICATAGYSGTLSIGNSSIAGISFVGPLQWETAGGSAAMTLGNSASTINTTGNFNWAPNSAAANITYNVATNTSDTVAKTVNIGHSGSVPSVFNIDGTVNFAGSAAVTFNNLFTLNHGEFIINSSGANCQLHLETSGTNVGFFRYDSTVGICLQNGNAVNILKQASALVSDISLLSAHNTLDDGVTGSMVIAGTSFKPGSVNTTSLGVAATPFTSLYLGSSAFSAGITTSGFSAARTLTIADPGAAASFLLTTTNPSAGSVFTNQAGSGPGSWVQPLRTFTSAASGFSISTGNNQMLGLAIAFTPSFSGKIMISGGVTCFNSSGAASTFVQAQVNYGTGTAPVHNAAITGTQIGGSNAISGSTIPLNSFISLPLYTKCVTGLTVGTPIWVDIAVSVTGGGPVTFSGVNFMIEEYP